LRLPHVKQKDSVAGIDALQRDPSRVKSSPSGESQL
jgi:hypothetical protein